MAHNTKWAIGESCYVCDRWSNCAILIHESEVEQIAEASFESLSTMRGSGEPLQI